MKIDALAALEIAHHEAVVREAYKDSAGIWTVSVGLTSATGHSVDRYIDRPQTLQHCIDLYVWALRRYAVGVDQAFGPRALTSHVATGALSFHWNTGRIKTASWVPLYKAGRYGEAEKALLAYNRAGGKVNAGLVRRRKLEADLIFRGVWSNDGTIMEYPVRKPSYAPDFRKGKRIKVDYEIARAFGLQTPPEMDLPPQPDRVPDVPTLTGVQAGSVAFAVAAAVAALIIRRNKDAG